MQYIKNISYLSILLSSALLLGCGEDKQKIRSETFADLKLSLIDSLSRIRDDRNGISQNDIAIAKQASLSCLKPLINSFSIDDLKLLDKAAKYQINRLNSNPNMSRDEVILLLTLRDTKMEPIIVDTFYKFTKQYSFCINKERYKIIKENKVSK